MKLALTLALCVLTQLGSAQPKPLTDIPLKDIAGKDTSLKPFAGKVLLIVNVASQCGATPQYSGLEVLHKEYGARGLAVLGFPCNDFGAQEPGTAAEIKQFCTTNYKVTFPSSPRSASPPARSSTRSSTRSPAKAPRCPVP